LDVELPDGLDSSGGIDVVFDLLCEESILEPPEETPVVEDEPIPFTLSTLVMDKETSILFSI
jgi:hypothetical protein